MFHPEDDENIKIRQQTNRDLLTFRRDRQSRAVIATVPNCSGHLMEHRQSDMMQHDRTSPPIHSIIRVRKTFGKFRLKCVNRSYGKKEKSAPEVFKTRSF